MSCGSGKRLFDVIDETHTLYFFSRDYELLAQVELTDFRYFYYVSEDYLYFADNRAINPVGWYLDKSQIGSGGLELQPLG